MVGDRQIVSVAYSKSTGDSNNTAKPKLIVLEFIIDQITEKKFNGIIFYNGETLLGAI